MYSIGENCYRLTQKGSGSGSQSGQKEEKRFSGPWPLVVERRILSDLSVFSLKFQILRPRPLKIWGYVFGNSDTIDVIKFSFRNKCIHKCNDKKGERGTEVCNLLTSKCKDTSYHRKVSRYSSLSSISTVWKWWPTTNLWVSAGRRISVIARCRKGPSKVSLGERRKRFGIQMAPAKVRINHQTQDFTSDSQSWQTSRHSHLSFRTFTVLIWQLLERPRGGFLAVTPSFKIVLRSQTHVTWVNLCL